MTLTRHLGHGITIYFASLIVLTGCGETETSELAYLRDMAESVPAIDDLAAGNEKLLGYWIRVDDEFANMVVRFDTTTTGNLAASVVYAPAAATDRGFMQGDIKIKDIQRLSQGRFSCSSLTKNVEIGVYEDYVSDFLEMPDTDTLLMRGTVWRNQEIGDTQRWRRITKGAKPMAFVHLGKSFAAETARDYAAALQYARDAYLIDGDKAETNNMYAWMLSTAPDKASRDPKQAIRLAKKACRLDGSNANYVDTLAAAYASNGDFGIAVKTQERACASFFYPPDGFVERLRKYRLKVAYYHPK